MRKSPVRSEHHLAGSKNSDHRLVWTGGSLYHEVVTCGVRSIKPWPDAVRNSKWKSMLSYPTHFDCILLLVLLWCVTLPWYNHNQCLKRIVGVVISLSVYQVSNSIFTIVTDQFLLRNNNNVTRVKCFILLYMRLLWKGRLQYIDFTLSRITNHKTSAISTTGLTPGQFHRQSNALVRLPR